MTCRQFVAVGSASAFWVVLVSGCGSGDAKSQDSPGEAGVGTGAGGAAGGSGGPSGAGGPASGADARDAALAGVDVPLDLVTADITINRPDGSPSSYNPCPPAGMPCRILPFGDSITDGAGSSGGGYRVPLFRMSLAAKQAITFVGSASNGPAMVDGAVFPRLHEGHSGFTIDPGGGRAGISPLVDRVMAAQKPHIVLLMIGTNDIDIKLDVANAPARLAAMLDKIAAAAPEALIVLAQMVPTGNDTTNGRVRDYNNAMPDLVGTRAAAGKHVILVDMYGAFTANVAYKTALMSDGLHPKDAGYLVMADVWYQAIGALLR